MPDITEEKTAILKIISLFKEAQQITSEYGWNNIAQPGLFIVLGFDTLTSVCSKNH